MAFKYRSLGTDKSLEEVARNALAKIHGPKGTFSEEEEEEEQSAKAKGTRRGTPKKAPAKAYKKQKEARDEEKAGRAAKERTRSKSRVQPPRAKVVQQDFDKDAATKPASKSPARPVKNVAAPFDD
tara:strand:+ start:663 stop:1040 length:378 start_codon:yes stop_codon:yes gene_type:complete